MGNFHVLCHMATLAKEMGCDWIRVPRKNIATFYPKEKQEAHYDSEMPYGRTYGVWRNMFEFTDNEFYNFDKYCKELHLPWFTTIMDWDSFTFFDAAFQLPAYKIASCNARNKPFLTKLAEHIPRNARIVASVAGSTLEQVGELIDIFPEHKMTIMHCVAEYPVPTAHLRLGNISVLRETFESARVSIGYSGHEMELAPSVIAARLGAVLIERHFTLQRHKLFPRANVALEPDEFATLIKMVRSSSEVILPAEAFRVQFGMSEGEKNFLPLQEYKECQK